VLVKVVTASGCAVSVTTPAGEANGHSLLELVMLAATSGTRVEIRVTGETCRETLEHLVELVNTGFGD